ncbi:MAG: MFS transporter [Acidimicrobiales bacterium]|nr:MFS transporter [Acidimicrobiales bacterium]
MTSGTEQNTAASAEPGPTAGASAPAVAAPATAISPRAWRALAVGSVAFSLMSFNTTATNLAFDDISETFSSSRPSTLAWVASVFFIGMASLLPVSGRLADRLGRRRVLRLGLILFIVGSTLSALAPAAAVLIAARRVCAAGGARVVPASLAVVLPEFPRERHMTAVAFWTASGPLASALAPAVSALILAATSWRALFALSIPIAAVALVGTYRVVRESKAAKVDGRLDWIGVLLGTVVVAGLVFAVGQGPSRGWTATSVVAAAVAVVVLFPVFLRRCRRHPQPLLNLDVFLLRPVWVANLANFLLNLGSMAVWLVWPLYLGRIWGYSKLQIGLSLIPGPIVSAIVTTFGGKVSERYGHEVLVRWGPAINVLSLAWPLLFMTQEPNYLVSVGPAIALTGAGWALTQPPLNSGVLSRVGADFYGEVNASFNTVRNVAGALGVAVAVAIIGDADRGDAVAAYDRVLYTFLASMVACWAVLLLLYPRRSRPAK